MQRIFLITERDFSLLNKQGFFQYAEITSSVTMRSIHGFPCWSVIVGKIMRFPFEKVLSHERLRFIVEHTSILVPIS